MKQAHKKRVINILWVLIYIITFVVVFIGSAIMKLTYNPAMEQFSYEWNDSVGTVYTDLVYGTGEANKFDLYVPKDASKETYGLIVSIHGGGFTAGDKSEDADMMKRFCSMGYVAASINYTLRTEKNPEASVYSQSVEIKNSIPFVVEEAEKLGYKLDRMAVTGSSAGGTLALIYAYRDADTSPLPVKMVFETVGPASFHHEDWIEYGLDRDPDAAAELFSVMSGNTITRGMILADNYDDEIKDISADMWVNENSVPTLLAYGKKDKICPFKSVRHLINALEDHGVPYDYFELPHSGHNLQNDDKILVQYYEMMYEYLDRYMSHS